MKVRQSIPIRMLPKIAWIPPVALVLGGCGVVGGVIIGGGTDFLLTGRTASFFQAIQIDPRSEDTAGPRFVVAEDLNNDGLTDLVSAWNQSQPVQIHIQRRSALGRMEYETVTLAGSVPVVSVAGVAVADFDQDGNFDIVVLCKDTLVAGPECLDSEIPAAGLSGLAIIYFGPSESDQVNQALAWEEVRVGASFLQGVGAVDQAPEEGGFTALTVGDLDLDDDMDIVVSWNSSCGGGTQDVVIFTNNGATTVRDGTWTATRIADDQPKGATIKGLALGDMDQDGDLDVVVTYPTAGTMNVRWYRNPAVDVPDDVHLSDGLWQVGAIGQVATGSDVIRLGDMDLDGLLDVVVRSTNGRLIQWFKAPPDPTSIPLRSIPWQTYTIAEYRERNPEAIALGDLTGDGRLEVIVSAEGGLSWFNSQAAATVYDQWIENVIIDEAPEQSADTSGSVNPATTDPNVTPTEVADTTLMNGVLVVDLDRDNRNDLLVTLDRSGLSGLTNDALVWFRSSR